MISHSKRFDEIDKIGQDMFFEEIKKQDQPYDNYVDIYDFFDVFLSSLRILSASLFDFTMICRAL